MWLKCSTLSSSGMGFDWFWLYNVHICVIASRRLWTVRAWVFVLSGGGGARFTRWAHLKISLSARFDRKGARLCRLGLLVWYWWNHESSDEDVDCGTEWNVKLGYDQFLFEGNASVWIRDSGRCLSAQEHHHGVLRGADWEQPRYALWRRETSHLQCGGLCCTPEEVF